jgi:hypothetical protein
MEREHPGLRANLVGRTSARRVPSCISLHDRVRAACGDAGWQIAFSGHLADNN